MTVLLGYTDWCTASTNILLVTSHYAGIVISALPNNTEITGTREAINHAFFY